MTPRPLPALALLSFALTVASCGDSTGSTATTDSNASSDSAGTSATSTTAAASTTAGDTTGATVTTDATGSSDGTTSPSSDPTTSPSTSDDSGSDPSTSSDTDPSTTADPSTESDTDGCACQNPEHICCQGECVDPRNNAFHCGGCGNACAQAPPFCDGGVCGSPPCEGSCGPDEVCCGASCCGAGTICCQVYGPVDTAPTCVAPSEAGTCSPGCAPLCMCAAPDTPIATPLGERPIAALRPGDLVYSEEAGQRVAVPLLDVQRVPVRDHQVVRVVLDDGGVLEISALHPLADGRSFGDLRSGDRLDDRRLVEVDTVPYAHAYTHDILPASESGIYFVHGVAVGSTMRTHSAPLDAAPPRCAPPR